MIRINNKTPLTKFSNDIRDLFLAIGVLNSGVCPFGREINCPKDGLFKQKQHYFCKICNHRFSQNTGTIFHSMKIKYELFYLIIQYFIRGLTAKQSKLILHLHYDDDDNKICSLRAIQKYYNLLRIILHNLMLNWLIQLQFVEDVEIDEACLFRKKSRIGRERKMAYWVFGIKGRTTKKSLIIPVNNRTNLTLLSIILSTIFHNLSNYFKAQRVYYLFR